MKAKKKKNKKETSKADCIEAANLMLKWKFYSNYHPSNDPDEAMHDFREGLSLRDAYFCRGLEIPEFLKT